MKMIPLTRGYVALVSDEDFERASQYHWHAKPKKNMVYASRYVRKADGPHTTQTLHRFLMGVTDPRIQVDHRDRDGLNNQRGNLRVATNAQNMANRVKKPGCASAFKGVTRKKWGRSQVRWCARITVDGRQRLLGYFKTEGEAAAAYVLAATAAFGAFSRWQPAKVGVDSHTHQPLDLIGASA